MTTKHKSALLLSLLITILFPGHTAYAQTASSSQKIDVLNMGTFHMRYTSDATKVDFNAYSKKNIDQIEDIVNRLAAFKPTIICVEIEPSRQGELNEAFQKYLKEGPNPESKFAGEVELIAFNLAQKTGVDTIYGINHKLNYLFWAIDYLAESKNVQEYTRLGEYKKGFAEKHDLSKYSLIEVLKYTNQPETKNFLISDNADYMTHVYQDKVGYEGADVAAEFYKRNLRMFTNLNRIEMTPEDRVFIIMGGSHTAFFTQFIERSFKYREVDIYKYLD